ncbi:amino acid transporter [Staphylococcus edaphicus]|uniref:Amino acid transporter n=1 Tax=Staphylococcus edaphicus TaxID=1955013 RepID=A0A2C6WM28_9STAP|nr:amino acid transporter [Staphylococcus edaphicus]PHK49429.1 amino acid transporter [Staphylococcus edaphicus]UQW81251.1 amino acid transporter [Staphylococcus edaphicus]
MALYKNIFMNLISKKSVWLLFIIGLYPLLILLTSLLPTNFMQISGEKNGLYGLDFFTAILSTQYQFVIPLILMAYFVSVIFYEEFISGRLIFFKDINRTKLLNSKLIALLSVYTIYFVILFLSSEFLFYAYLVHFDYASNKFLPNELTTTLNDLLIIISTILSSFISVYLAIMLSMKFSTGFTILGVIFSFMLISISPMVKGLDIFFPAGYTNAHHLYNFGINLSIMLIITMIYCSVFYFISRTIFNKLEY